MDESGGAASLLHAVRRSDWSTVERVIRLNPKWVDVLSDDGNRTPLLIACRAGDLKTVQILVNAGASLEKGNVTQGVTPLILSAYENRPELVKFLLEKGADANVVDDDGDTALYAATARGNEDCVAELLKPQYKCDVNKLNNKTISAAIVAIVKNRFNVCNEVLKSPSFNPRLLDRQDMNCLHLAAAYGNARALAIILKVWPEGINEKHKDGFTPLGIACNQNHAECVKVLLEQEDCDRESRFLGGTSLHHAVTRGNLEIVKLLVQHTVDLNSKDNDGDTGLHLCCMLKSRATDLFTHLSEMSGLLSGLSNMSELLKDHKLPTPEKQEAIATFLVQSGASLDIRNHRGKTPLDMLRGRLTQNTTNQNLQTKSQTTKDVCHTGVICDNCEMSPIRGIRHKCTRCSNYDLCKNCMELDVHGHNEYIAYTKPKDRKTTVVHADNSDRSTTAMFSADLPTTQMYKINDSVKKSNTSNESQVHLKSAKSKEGAGQAQYPDRPDKDPGSLKLSEKDIRLITHKAGLGKADLDNLFGELEISSENQEKGKCDADTTDFQLRGLKVLLNWRKNKGKSATRHAILKALQECDLNNAVENLEALWDPTSFKK